MSLRDLPYIRILAEHIQQPGETLQSAFGRLDAMAYCDLEALWADLPQK